MPDKFEQIRKHARLLGDTRLHWSFVPRFWKDSNQTKHLVWSRPRRWDPKKRDDIPQEPGVYAFLLIPSLEGVPQGSYVLYIGKAEQSLRERYGGYANEPKRKNARPRILKMFRTWPKHLWYSYAVTSKTKANHAELKLRSALIPPINYDIDADLNAAQKAFP